MSPIDILRTQITKLDTALRVTVVVLGILGFIVDLLAGIKVQPAAWGWLASATVTVWGSHAALAHQSRKIDSEGVPGMPSKRGPDGVEHR